MGRCSRVAMFAAFSILAMAAPAWADSLRCQSVNGNLNCAGSDGVACQTVNGKKTCVSGHGDVVQSFGKGSSSALPDQQYEDGAADDDEDMEDARPAHGSNKHMGQHDAGNRKQ